MIEIVDLTYIYGKGCQDEVTALCNVSLSIAEGEFVAVLGANGSGKSTLAKHFNGILLPTSGDVIIDGLDTRNAEDLLKIRERVGFILQNPDNQIVATVVGEDVAFGPENLGIPPAEIRRRVTEALSAVHMEDYAGSQPHFLSDGQKQKVAIAGVLALKPKYLVLDEPTSQLDPSSRKEVLSLIRGLNKTRGVTIVYVTHFTEEIVEADRLLVVSGGRIVLDGPPKDVLSDYQKLERLGVRAPRATVLADNLFRAGLNIPREILTVEGLADSLCSLS